MMMVAVLAIAITGICNADAVKMEVHAIMNCWTHVTPQQKKGIRQMANVVTQELQPSGDEHRMTVIHTLLGQNKKEDLKRRVALKDLTPEEKIKVQTTLKFMVDSRNNSATPLIDQQSDELHKVVLR